MIGKTYKFTLKGGPILSKIKTISGIFAVLTLVFIIGWDVNAETYEYDKLNRISKVTYEDGIYSVYSYDANGNMTKVRLHNSNESDTENENGNEDIPNNNPGNNSQGNGANQSGSQGSGSNGNDDRPNSDKNQSSPNDSGTENGGSNSGGTEEKENAAPSPVIHAKKVTLNTKRVYVVKGRSVSVKATLSPKNTTDKVKWKSSKKSIATVKNGKIIGVKTGKATITVTATSGKKAKCTVYVVKKARKSTSIKLNKKSVSLKAGLQYTLRPTVKPYNSTDKIKWTSSKKSVVTVDKFGTITAKKKGNATITARISSGKTAKCKVRVKK